MFDFKIDNRERFLGWCPGEYIGKCNKCSCTFIGDKRSTTCADCAYAVVPEGKVLVSISELESIKSDLLERAEEDSEGLKVVNLGDTNWRNLKSMIEGKI